MNVAIQFPLSSRNDLRKNPLRVAVFSGNYNYVIDGPARALNMLVDFLERQGHEALVFAPTVKNPVLEHKGTLVPARSIPFPVPGRGEYRLGLSLSASARARLERFQPDLIHVASPDFAGFCALDYARKNNIPAVASFHTRFDAYPRYYRMRWLEPVLREYLRYFYSRCAHVYAPSPSMAETLRAERIGRDIRLWTRGVDNQLFNPNKRDMDWRRAKGFADDDVVIAFVGRLVLEKGLGIFTDAYEQLTRKSPKARALIVGGGPERARFETRLRTGVFTGFLQGEDLARAYASADIFFNPSITETFGNVTLEAMASGLPSVCAEALGSVSLVENGKTGLLSPPEGGAAAYAERLAMLAGAPGLRRGLGEAARAHSLTFEWDVILNGLVEHYFEAVNGYRRKLPEAGASPRPFSREHAA